MFPLLSPNGYLASRRRERRGLRGQQSFSLTWTTVGRLELILLWAHPGALRGLVAKDNGERLLPPWYGHLERWFLFNVHSLWKCVGPFPASVCWGTTTFRIWEGHIRFTWNTGEANVSIRYLRKGWSLLWLICDHLTLYISHVRTVLHSSNLLNF